ncbi:sigma-70 family RNA polymerase sigma factor [Pandoraea sp. ISTKB]|uniref:sigma-70 family RNA polymerase sigma factor n=1 Tax=Pandoraea sp. ISTKB TaxID=1586708 RepID=UPI000846448A|nr:sigma-70 family RNA polymerase sigma factor [Pandoraea sp. ISTKB]ODP32852.1 RNA polymerase subunit sigma-24 [Pandoraea sp. ISTKB]
MSDMPESERRERPASPAGLTDDAHTPRSGAPDGTLNALLAAVGQADREAFAELYRATSSRLFGVILRMVRDRAEAEDLLQEVFVNIWRRAEAFDPARGNAMTWLIATARNRTIDRLREHREGALDDSDALAIPSEDPTPAALAEASEERRRLEQCMQGLEPQQRGVVREAFFSGASYSELANRLSVPLGTLKSWIRRSLMQLKVCLDR